MSRGEKSRRRPVKLVCLRGFNHNSPIPQLYFMLGIFAKSQVNLLSDASNNIYLSVNETVCPVNVLTFLILQTSQPDQQLLLEGLHMVPRAVCTSAYKLCISGGVCIIQNVFGIFKSYF